MLTSFSTASTHRRPSEATRRKWSEHPGNLGSCFTELNDQQVINPIENFAMASSTSPDVLWGSVTERVLREAPCPVLAAPVM